MSAPELFSTEDYQEFLGLARAALHRLPWDVQEDIAQKVYVKLETRFRRQVEDLRQNILNRKHLYKILRNAEMDYYRKLRREIPQSQLVHLPPEPSVAARPTSVWAKGRCGGFGSPRMPG